MNASVLAGLNPREALSDLDWSASAVSTTLEDGDTLSGRESFVIIKADPEHIHTFTVKAAGEEPAWLVPTLQSLGEMLALPDNWDSYGAPRIGLSSIVSAIELLSITMRPETPAPLVVPTTRGGLQLEWHTRGIDLEVEVESPNRIFARYEDHNRGVTWEDEMTFNLKALAECIAALSRHH